MKDNGFVSQVNRDQVVAGSCCLHPPFIIGSVTAVCNDIACAGNRLVCNGGIEPLAVTPVAQKSSDLNFPGIQGALVGENERIGSIPDEGRGSIPINILS